MTALSRHAKDGKLESANGEFKVVVDEAFSESQDDELESAGNAELSQDVVHVVLNRLFTDEEFLSNGAIVFSLGDKREDLKLPWAEAPGKGG